MQRSGVKFTSVCAVLLGTLILAATAAWAPAQEQVFQPMGVGGGGAIFAPSVSPYDSNFMLISTDMGGCYRSYDGGKSWTQIPFTQLAAGAGMRALFLKDEVYWQGTAVWQSPLLKVSRDKGKTWTALSDKFPWGGDGIKHLVAVEAAPIVLLAGNNKGLWRSADKGKTWEAIAPEGKKCSGIVVLGDRVLAARGGDLAESRDGGKTWKNIPVTAAKGKDLLAVAGGADKGGDSVLYTIAQDLGTLQSLDEGKTWALVQPWDQQNDVQMAGNQTQIAFTAQSDSAGRAAFGTSDKGKTWQNVFPPQEPESKLDWTQIEMKWDYRLMGAGLCVSPSDAKLVMVSSIGDAYVSHNAGKSWVPLTTADASLPPQAGNPYKRWKTNGLQVTGCYSFHVDPSDKDRFFAGHSDVGLLRSIDGGATWSTLSYRGSPWGNSFYQIAFDPFLKNRVYAAASNTHDIPDWRLIDDLPTPQTGGVVISEDGGDTWKRLWALDPEKVITSICVDAKASKDKDNVVLYAAAYDDGVYKSTDSGKTWAKKSNGLGYPGNARVHRVIVHPESGNVYAVIVGRKHNREFRVPGGLWKSTDGGESWTDLTAGLKLMWPAGYFSINPRDEQSILLSASGGPGCDEQGGVWKTTDGGKTWKHTLTGEAAGKYYPPNVIQAWDTRYNAADPSVAYLGTVFHGLWYSHDGGDTWKPFKEFPHGSAMSAQTDPRDPKKILVNTFGGGLWRGPYLPPEEMK